MQNPELSDFHLTVYRASAGSGKTHQLTSEYLKLLYSSPFAYRHILAVTFTNKATDEMKGRIVVELSRLASGGDSGHLKTLMSYYSQDEMWVREQGRSVLLKILHDYSAFSISTIDRFFQQTMRAFARELGLNGGYNVELDSGKVLKESIDSMLYDLENQNDTQLLEWLIRFSEEKIENGDTWNIRSDIQSLAQEIFKEEYKNHSDDVQRDISDKSLLDSYKKQLEEIIYKFRKTSQSIGERALNIMLRHGLDPTDFKGGSKSQFLWFKRWAEGEIKAPNKTFLAFQGDVDSWYIKTTDKSKIDHIREAFADGLNDAVFDIIVHYDETLFYHTALEINRYFFALGILGDVDRKVREYTSEQNVMLISDTTELLRKIINDDEAPFVYEKVGTRVDNYMIDEFQDTSGMQWNNFRPLIKNSMASGDKNLIVGDVKQSIYRWRNSDWNLLDEQLDEDFAHEGLNKETLATNWRSAQNIVLFNNTVFSKGSEILQAYFNASLSEEPDDKRLSSLTTKIKRAYKDASQILPKEKDVAEGRVQIEFIDTEDEDNWHSVAMERLPLAIESLQDDGYSLRDIAILVRTKKEGAEVADTMLNYKREHENSRYKYDIISDEALYLGNAQIVKLVLSLMKYLRNSADLSLRTLAVYEYFRFTEQLSPEEALHTHFSVEYNFPDEIVKILEHIQELPVYEMTEELFALFSKVTTKEDNIYIQSFLDSVLDFSSKNSSDLDSFLRWWEETGVKKTIFTPDSQDAIRIMTIHKSKGLEFEVTIIPFCSWDIDNRLERILWCQPSVAPFNALHLVPVKYSSSLSSTIFRYEYFKERLHTFIDNLNILYVAFTRPKERLIAFSPKPTDRAMKSGEIRNTATLLWSIINEDSAQKETDECLISNLSEYLSTDDFRFEMGENDSLKTLDEERNEVSQLEIKSLPSIPFEQRLRLSLNNKYFFAPDGSREYGTLLHEIVGKIEYFEDLDSTLDDYYLSGDISSEERENIRQMLLDFIENPLIREWYSKEYRVLNEIQILLPNGKFVRPDRIMVKGDMAVVVDYKFGEHEDKKYDKQVKAYVDYVRKIGYKNVSGFLFYVALNKIIEVS